jgi:hypothetical protein
VVAVSCREGIETVVVPKVSTRDLVVQEEHGNRGTLFVAQCAQRFEEALKKFPDIAKSLHMRDETISLDRQEKAARR